MKCTVCNVSQFEFYSIHHRKSVQSIAQIRVVMVRNVYTIVYALGLITFCNSLLKIANNSR